MLGSPRILVGGATCYARAMTPDTWSLLQFVSTGMAGVIAVLGIAFDLRDGKTKRLTGVGYAAIATAILTSGVALGLLWHNERKAVAEAETQRSRYAELVRQSNRVLSDVRRGLYPIDHWKVSLRLSVPLNRDDPAEAGVSDILGLQLVDALRGNPPSGEHIGWPVDYADFSDILLKTGAKSSRLNEICRLALDIRFVPLPIPEDTFPAPACTADACPGDGGSMTYFREENALFLDTGPLDLGDFVAFDSALVRSVFDLAGKAMLVTTMIGDSDLPYQIEELELDFGPPMFVRTVPGSALDIEGGARRLKGMAFPCCREDVCEGSPPSCTDDEALLEMLRSRPG